MCASIGCSEEQLLEDNITAQATQPQQHSGWPGQDRLRHRSSNNLQSHAHQSSPKVAFAEDSPIGGVSGLGSMQAPQAMQKSSMQEQLSQQLPGSFASMSASFASPQAMHQAQQAHLGPHDPAWFREAQTGRAQMAAAQSLLSPQQQQQHQQLQSQSSSAHNSMLLQHQQQHAVRCAQNGFVHQQPSQLGNAQHELLMQQLNQSSNPQDVLFLQQQQLQLQDDVLQAWQQDLQPPTGLSQYPSPGLDQQQSLLLLAAQQQMLNEQLHASKLQWDQQQQQLLLAAAALQPLGDTSGPLPTALLQQQQHQAEGVWSHAGCCCLIQCACVYGGCVCVATGVVYAFMTARRLVCSAVPDKAPTNPQQQHTCANISMHLSILSSFSRV